MTTDNNQPEFDTSIAGVRALHERLDAAHDRLKTLAGLLNRLRDAALHAASQHDMVPDWFCEIMDDSDWALSRCVDIMLNTNVQIRLVFGDVPVSINDDALLAAINNTTNSLDFAVDSYYHRAVERVIEALPLGENISIEIEVDDVSVRTVDLA